MKPRDFLNFFKTKSGKLFTFGALFAAALIIFSVGRKHHTSAEDKVNVTVLATNATDKPQVVQSVVRQMQAFYPPPPKPEPTNYLSKVPSSASPGLAKPPPLPVVPVNQTRTLSPISLFADSSAGIAPVKKLSAVFAPFGRLIPCETVITVDSSSTQVTDKHIEALQKAFGVQVIQLFPKSTQERDVIFANREAGRPKKKPPQHRHYYRR